MHCVQGKPFLHPEGGGNGMRIDSLERDLPESGRQRDHAVQRSKREVLAPDQMIGVQEEPSLLEIGLPQGVRESDIGVLVIRMFFQKRMGGDNDVRFDVPQDFCEIFHHVVPCGFAGLLFTRVLQVVPAKDIALPGGEIPGFLFAIRGAVHLLQCVVEIPEIDRTGRRNPANQWDCDAVQHPKPSFHHVGCVPLRDRIEYRVFVVSRFPRRQGHDVRISVAVQSGCGDLRVVGMGRDQKNAVPRRIAVP